MIKLETVGGIQASKLNAVLTKTTAIENYTFITDNGITYMADNQPTGDMTYDHTIAAGEYINGLNVASVEGLHMIADEKHIAYASSKSYADIVAGTTLLKPNAAGKLEVAETAPTEGVYFKVVAKCRLNEKAVKMLVIVADKVSSAG